MGSYRPGMPTLTHIAAELRANYKLHYTDCFAVALASNRKASLLTSDSDFAHVQKLVPIIWAT